jgi:hypothetical protein
MYLKKDERVVAYLHMHVMALMVSALIERTLRRAMARKKLTSIPIYPEGRPCPAPTMFDVVRLFQNVERYEAQVGEETIVFPAELTDRQKQVLELLEVPFANYQ